MKKHTYPDFVSDRIKEMLNLQHFDETRCARRAMSRCGERKIKEDQRNMKGLLLFGDVLIRK